MNKNIKTAFFTLLGLCCLQMHSQTSKQNLTQYVDPYIGTGFHGHVFMGANVPFGGVQLGPVNISQGWDWCSGYHYSDQTIIGFSHTHLSGTGIGDLGDFLFMPAIGKVNLKKGTAKDMANGYISDFDRKDEKAKPGYYSVILKKNKIKAEMTATERVGFQKYTFPASDQSHIVLDLVEGIGWDRAVDTYIRIKNDTLIEGYRFSKGWANDQRIYFAAILSKPAKKIQLYENTKEMINKVVSGDSAKAVIHFSTSKDEVVKIKVGISPVSTENALMNIKKEISGWDFEKVATQADEKWNNELGKMAVKSSDPAKMKIFYTALYHTMIAPSIFNDANGDYYGTDKQVHRAAGFTNLTTFSLWDTYRGANPLFTLTQPEKVSDMINSMLAIYKESGHLPVWHLMGNETYCMPGNSAIQIVADAYLKGIKGIDGNLAFEAVKATAMQDDRGVDFVKKLGYIPGDSLRESVSYGLEYAISDGAIAMMAKKMGKTDDYNYFFNRSKAYKKYFDPSVGFVRARLSETTWRTPFDPFKSIHEKGDFSEGNAWQYTWLVPQDVEGLIALLGGEKPFAKKLDTLFTISGDMGKEASSDITGLIGQYAHGNEPSHHITYLYNFVGQPWKTAEKVRYIVDNLYSDKPDGLCGNEDVGQMSAWYVWNAMGMYSANPYNGVYCIGSPSMDESVLKLADGKTFTVKALNNSSKNIYIQKATLNGKEYTKSYILHTDVMKGGELIFTMGAKPSKTWGVSAKDRPYSAQ
ncbi:glycoside hydrolase family 92 protein [Flavobacterium zhairuonense]|uniref:GH92 family glycosyl hydrolase n=1 Tax=Flavobacterium zhairuonense TaxID=2493631 RepID=UPI00104D6609|nr:GH92 family glycosyl hydrolase [Flavobacterium zhairuonense]KAF2513674.1 glycoside hydrolase family 92 protein [Flavobacterium zhairuonense]